MISVFNQVENIVGKGENAGHHVFKRLLPQGSQKSELCSRQLTNDKILDFSKLKTFANDKVHVT